MSRRVLVYPPTHPALVAVYTVAAALIVILASGAMAGVLVEWLGPRGLPLALLASWLLVLSPPLSFVNIVVARIRHRGVYQAVLEVEYQVVFGIPVPVPRVRLVEASTLLAVNVGGALVPAAVSGILLYAAYSAYGGGALWAALAAASATAAVTFAFSRAVEGVGVVVPAILPPVTSALASTMLVGPGPEASAIAYFAGTIGSLLGADVLRLAVELRRIKAPVVSVGGAGVFDGVFLSGLLAALLAG